MVNKEELLGLILARPHTYTIHDFKDIYQMDSAENFIVLNKMLNQLENQFLIVRDKKDRYCDAKESGMYQGKISVNKRGFGFLDLDDDHSIFIPKTEMNMAMDQDIVVVKANGAIKENPEGSVIKIIERNSKSIICTYRKLRNFVCFADDERITQRIKVTNESAFRLVDGLKVKCSIISFSDPLVVKIEKVIGHENDPGVDIQSVLYNYGIESEFPHEVMKEIKEIPEEISDEERSLRKDLTNQTIVTIDGDDSKDLDDAISLTKTERGYLLGVHIADVSYYVREGSELDKEAYKRGTSTYVVDRVVPMLPHYLSNGICSLNEGVERLTMSCEMEIDEYGDILDYQIFPSIIKSTARMTYNHVNLILQDDKELCEKYQELVPLFKLMKECATAIRTKRSAYGAIDFDRDEAKILVDKKGRVSDIKLRLRGESECIIEDFMVTANECVARHTKWLQIPSLYRVHETPMLKKMQEFSKITGVMGYKLKGSLQDIRPQQLQHCLLSFKDEECYPVVSIMLLRCMQKARYARECLGHFGLALEDYTHFTSPIRRYPDLIVHRMIRKYAFSGLIDAQEMEKDEILMDEMGENTSICERRSTDAEREVEDMKKAEYMSTKLNQKFEAMICSITKFGFYVELPNTVEGLVHIQDLRDDYYNYDPILMQLKGERTGRIFRLGQAVEVQLVSTDKEKREINFVLAKDKKARQKPKGTHRTSKRRR